MTPFESPREDFLNKVTHLRRGGPGNAPRLHKPLLVLGLLQRYEIGRTDPVPLSVIASPLVELLREFGPPVKTIHPHYPFWRLQQDGIWEVRGAASLPLTASHDPSPRSLTDDHPGQFLAPFKIALTEEVNLINEAQRRIIATYFQPQQTEAVKAGLVRAWT